MNDLTRTAVVTGANRGIGYETCRQLAQRGLKVILTARDAAKGKSAVETLRGQGLDVVFQTLDVTDPASIGELVNFIEDRFGRVDVLINNAGIMLENLKPGGVPVSVFKASVDTVRTSMETNVYGPLLLSQALKPLMHGDGRIVNVSSGMGQLTDMNGGWPGYRISKTALNALTRILADELKSTNIKVNSMCPGWVRTDMGGPNAERSLEKGAETIVWLATLPDDGPSGGFFRDKQAIPW